MNAKEIIKKIVFRIFYYSGSLFLYRILFPLKEPLILTFHRVNKKYFEKQMKYLKKNYNVISLEHYVNNLKKKELFSKNTIVITFDDGYLNNYIYAYPILKKLDLRATIYISYDFINKNLFAWWDRLEFANKDFDLNELKKKSPEFIEKETIRRTGFKIDSKKPKNYDFMDWKQVKQIIDVFEIGAHSLTHPILTNISIQNAKKEIIDSKNQIEKKIGQTIVSFSYPNGNSNLEIEKIIRNNGFNSSVVYVKGKNSSDNIFRLHRRGINIKDDKFIFAAKVAGVF